MTSSAANGAGVWFARFGTAVLVAVAVVLGLFTAPVAVVLALGQPLPTRVGAVGYLILLLAVPWFASARARARSLAARQVLRSAATSLLLLEVLGLPFAIAAVSM